MRPCSNCGVPIANNLANCRNCEASSEAGTKCIDNATPSDDRGFIDERGVIRGFLWWAFGILVLLVPGIGYLLGGTAIAVIFGILGFIVFVMLEKTTH